MNPKHAEKFYRKWLDKAGYHRRCKQHKRALGYIEDVYLSLSEQPESGKLDDEIFDDINNLLIREADEVRKRLNLTKSELFLLAELVEE